METNYITLTKENIADEHICCAFSDKKCKDSYELKKAWLKKEFDNGGSSSNLVVISFLFRWFSSSSFLIL